MAVNLNDKLAYHPAEDLQILYAVTGDGISVLNNDGSFNKSIGFTLFHHKGLLLDSSEDYLWAYGASTLDGASEAFSVVTRNFP